MVTESLNKEKNQVKKLKRGDEKAFEFLFEKYKRKLRGFLDVTLPSNIDPDEIIQVVFIKVWKNRKTIDPNKSFSSFLFTIAKNETVSQLRLAVNRKLKFYGFIFPDANEPSVANYDFSEEELESTLTTVVKKMPERRRQIFKLRHYEGLSYKQIANRLSITENTVDVQIRKSLKFLRSELNNFLT